MNFQITVLKVLAAHPEGRASLADLKRYMAVLASSGPDWSERMRRLSGRTHDLDIFSSGFVIRDIGSWHITPAGLDFLSFIEAPAARTPVVSVQPTPPAADTVRSTSNVISLVEHVRRRAAA